MVRTPTLEGPTVELAPLAPSDAAGLLAAADTPETFRWFTRPPSPWSAEGMGGYGAHLLADPTIRPYTVRLRGSGEIVGSTTYCDLRPGHRGVEIGWTWYAPGHRGTRVNPECKRLLLDCAFSGDLFGEPAVRVCLKTDARNERSRRAILGLGAAFEGVLRSHLIMPDGHRRDSAMYSITEAEWPAVRRRLDERLATP
jgi:RimJ/RimL family protein N-acetyltransferase